MNKRDFKYVETIEHTHIKPETFELKEKYTYTDSKYIIGNEFYYSKQKINGGIEYEYKYEI